MGNRPAPKDPADRRRRNKPALGEMVPASGVGWQHGVMPDAPDGLMPASVEAWRVWMGAWFAAFWLPEDLPALRQMVRLYDQVERGEFQRASELRLTMESLGATPKGQQDRRWKKPEAAPEATTATPGGRYGHLRPA